MTTEVKGRTELRGAGDKLKDLARSLNPEGGQQYMPGWARDVTYISRLQCVQAAVDAQLTALEREHPNSRVGLVAFNDDVTLLGDGHQSQVVLGTPIFSISYALYDYMIFFNFYDFGRFINRVVAGDKLKEYEEALRTGTTFVLEKPVTEAKSQLSAKLFSLEEKGATALGTPSLR